MKFEFNWPSGFWGNYVLMCWWDSNISDFGWKVKGQPRPLNLFIAIVSLSLTYQGGTSFVDLLCFCSVLCLLCFVRVCLYVLCGHLLGKGWPLGSRLWCLLWVCHFPIGILGQVWYLNVSIPDLCTLTYLTLSRSRSTYDHHLNNFVGPTSPMLHTKPQGHWLSGSGEEDF